MSIASGFKNLGHFFATLLQKAASEAPKAAAVIAKIEGTASTVEAITAAIPTYGPLAVTAEKVSFAALGELGAVLTAGGSAASAKLVDAGLDINVIQTIEAFIASVAATKL